MNNNALRGHVLTEGTRKSYHSTILSHFIPFLKKNNIKSINEIDTPLLANFQDYCLANGNKPQTVNTYVCYVNNIMDYLIIRGIIKVNPCASLTAIRLKDEDNEARECYDVDEMQGVFTRRWKDESSYLLNLLIYTTGMRNCEIDNIRVKDIIRINKVRFIHVTKSKTKSGIRNVPLHNFVYQKLLQHIRKYGKKPDDRVISQDNGRPLPRQHYTNANIALGMFTRQVKGKNKLSEDEIKEVLQKENITFYSGRHFWKTMMNGGGLGDVEEFFMGHKVKAKVAELYNHRERQGRERIAVQAKRVFKILDKNLLTKKAR